MMAVISEHFVKQFNAAVDILSQQKGSKLRNAVRLKTDVVGEDTYIDQIGKTAAVQRTVRHADTPIVNTDHQRRKISMVDWEWADLIDKADKLKMLADPAGEYALNAAYALGRAMDDAIITAAFGSAWTGVAGAIEETWASVTNEVAMGTTNLTVVKLLAAKKLLDDADVDPDEPRFIACCPSQIISLLNTTEVKSSDYNTVKALARGEMMPFIGFTFIPISPLLLDVEAADPSARRVIAWAKSGLALAIAQDIEGQITERADKSYSTQVYKKMSIGATRLDPDKVVEIICEEA